jgi:hypothetical protein
VDPQRYARVKQVFREAMRWAPGERAAVVAELAGEDTGLRDEVLSLLAHHDDAPLIREPAQSLSRIASAAVAGAATPEEENEPAAEEQPAAKEQPVAPAPAVAAKPGRTLAELLRSERAGGAAAGWPIERVVDTLEPVVEALARIADRGGAHGAVRAERIIVTEAGGELVARLDEETSGAPGPAKIEGAGAASAAPEQLLPVLGPTGPWSDVYALALLCVELMLGRPAVEGSAGAALARTREETKPPTPRAVELSVRSAIEAVMAMALAMRPMERYQNVRRFWTALRESVAASRHALPTAPPGAMMPLPSSSPAARPRALASARHAPPRRWRAWAAIVALAVAAAVGAVAIAASRCG